MHTCLSDYLLLISLPLSKNKNLLFYYHTTAIIVWIFIIQICMTVHHASEKVMPFTLLWKHSYRKSDAWCWTSGPWREGVPENFSRFQNKNKSNRKIHKMHLGLLCLNPLISINRLRAEKLRNWQNWKGIPPIYFVCVCFFFPGTTTKPECNLQLKFYCAGFRYVVTNLEYILKNIKHANAE